MKKITFVLLAPFLVFFGATFILSSFALLLMARLASRERVALFFLSMADLFYYAYTVFREKDDEQE